MLHERQTLYTQSARLATAFRFSAVLAAFSLSLMCSYVIPSKSHCFCVQGYRNNLVYVTGYETICLPLKSGVPMHGYPNGGWYPCHKKVTFSAPFLCQKEDSWLQPASALGKNLLWPRGIVDGTPACTKSPRINSIWCDLKVCKKPYLLVLLNGSGRSHMEKASIPKP